MLAVFDRAGDFTLFRYFAVWFPAVITAATRVQGNSDCCTQQQNEQELSDLK